MNQAIKDLWKKNFPLWPDVLIYKFSDQIEIEANFFNSAFGADQKQFFDDTIKNLNRNFSLVLPGWFATAQNGQLSLFNPSNPKYYTRQDYNFGRHYLYQDFCPPSQVGNQNSVWDQWHAWQPFQKRALDFVFTGIWDSRLFGNLDLSVSVNANPNGAPYSMSYLSIMSYDSTMVAPILNVLSVNMVNAAKIYAQSDSLIALHENGKDMPGIDYAKLYEFNTYLKAYQNYGAQIQGAADVAKKTAAADILNYKSDLDSKLLAQKNNLQNLTLQLTSQTAAEAASAKRDMQQLSLQVATIKLQIMGLVK